MTFPSEEAAQQFAYDHGLTVGDLRKQADAAGVDFIDGEPDSTFGRQGLATFHSEQEMRDFAQAHGTTPAALARQAEADGVELISSRPAAGQASSYNEILAAKERGDIAREQAAQQREQAWIEQTLVSIRRAAQAQAEGGDDGGLCARGMIGDSRSPANFDYAPGRYSMAGTDAGFEAG